MDNRTIKFDQIHFFDIISNSTAENEKCLMIETVLKNDERLINRKSSSLGGITALHLAASLGLIDVVKLLLRYKADVNQTDYNNWSPLHHAVEAGHEDMVILLCNNNINVNIASSKQNETALHISAANGYFRCIEILLASGLPVDTGVKNIRGQTAENLINDITHYPTRVKVAESFTRTLNSIKSTPLQMAILDNNFDRAKRLLELDAPVNETDLNLCTALHYAAACGHASILMLLCYQSDIKINQIDKSGETALHKCVTSHSEYERGNHHKCIKILVTAKLINKRIRNNAGKTTEDLIQNLDDTGNQKKLKSDALSSLPLSNMTLRMNFSTLQRHSFKIEDFRVVQGKYKELDLSAPSLHIDVKSEFESNAVKTRERSKLSVNKSAGSHVELRTASYVQDAFHSKNLHKMIEYLKQINDINIMNDEINLISKSIKENPDNINDMIFIHDVLKYFQSAVIDIKQNFHDAFQRDERDLNNAMLNCPKSSIQSTGTVEVKRNYEDIMTKSILKICQKNGIDKLESIRLHTLGLLTYLNPENVIFRLNQLHPDLQPVHRLTSSLIVKELLLLSMEFGYDISNISFQNNFKNYLNNCEANDIAEILKSMLTLASELNGNMTYYCYNKLREITPFKTINSLDNIFDKIQNLSGNQITDSAKYIANELTQISIRFFQSFKLDDYTNTFKSKNAKIDMPGNVISKLFSLNDSFMSFIQKTILMQPTNSKRAKIISLFILSANECLNHNLMPNLNHASIITATLQSQSISRLRKSFDLVDKDLIEKFDKLKKLTSENLSAYREFQKAYKVILPYLIVNSSDYTHLQECPTSPDLLFKMGTLFNQLFKLRKSLELLIPENHSDLIIHLMNDNPITEELLEELSYKAQPKIIELSLSSKPDLSNIKCILDILEKYKLPLIVKFNGKKTEGQKALSTIDHWLKNFNKDVMNDDDVKQIKNRCIEHLKNINDSNVVITNHSIFFKKKESLSKIQPVTSDENDKFLSSRKSSRRLFIL